ncbi:MAG: hypothetical protein ACHQT9_02750 [Candidatus Saccharimonadales bacterium]
MEKGNEIGVPPIIAEHTVARSLEDQQYLDIVRLCHALGEWYPEATQEQCDGRTDHPVQRPNEEHPVLLQERYHRERVAAAPLNVRGRKKLKSMQRRYDLNTSRFESYLRSEIMYGSEPDIMSGWDRYINS